MIAAVPKADMLIRPGEETQHARVFANLSFLPADRTTFVESSQLAQLTEK
jgi:hypothetical protein